LIVLAAGLLALVLQGREAGAVVDCVAPKAWGPVRAVTNPGDPYWYAVAFEAEDGTIRIVHTSGNCSKPQTVIRRE
jgi:hypothetical protein